MGLIGLAVMLTAPAKLAAKNVRLVRNGKPAETLTGERFTFRMTAGEIITLWLAAESGAAAAIVLPRREPRRWSRAPDRQGGTSRSEFHVQGKAT